jgi:hypothetical protein
VLRRIDWVYAVEIVDDQTFARHGPFNSEEDAVSWIEHEHLEGHFDLIKNIHFYKDKE